MVGPFVPFPGPFPPGPLSVSPRSIFLKPLYNVPSVMKTPLRREIKLRAYIIIENCQDALWMVVKFQGKRVEVVEGLHF